jgi:hypothetical protein
MQLVLSLPAGGQPQLAPNCCGFARIGRPTPSCYAVASRRKENRLMDDRAFASATQLANEIRDRRIGCVELLDFYLARAERHNPALNAIVVWQLEQARERARAADAAVARGEHWGPLHGIPMTVKESFRGPADHVWRSAMEGQHRRRKGLPDRSPPAGRRDRVWQDQRALHARRRTELQRHLWDHQ